MARRLEEGFTIGCDPELFIKDKDNNLVSAVGLIPGTKTDPYKVRGGAIQVDGMAAEINTEPVNNWNDFNMNILMVLEQLKAMLPSGYGFVMKPSVRFSQEVLDATPDYAKEMGCDPDFNAWTSEENPRPDTSTDPALRCAGGHVHIGWTDEADIADDEHLGHCRDLVKQLDWFLGGWALRIDKDTERRKLYGKEGAFRPKPYGVEYRVLSNCWISTTDRRANLWNRTCDAIREMRRCNMPELREKDNSLLVEYINTGKKPDALENIKYPLVTSDIAYAPVRLIGEE